MAPHAVEVTITVTDKRLDAGALFAAYLLRQHPQWAIHLLLDPQAPSPHAIDVNDRDAELLVAADLVRWLGRDGKAVQVAEPLDPTGPTHLRFRTVS